MKPRITVSLTEDGTLEIALNEMGRDQLVRELQALSEKNDHFHLAPPESGYAEITVAMQGYRATDEVIGYGKVMLRPDEWDRRFYPHVIGDDDTSR